MVFGASESRRRPGNVALQNLRRGFTGEISVVHPTATEIDGLAVFHRVGDIPTPIDLAVVAVPASAVPQVIEQCGVAGVRAAVVLSAGFSETGGDGAALQADMLASARRYGMRLVGPNCFGVANPAIGLDTTFGVNKMRVGSIALASQSGGLGIALLAEAHRRGLGISSFVSLGNKADISGNDTLCYWAEDPATKVIALYLESFGNPRRFASLARAISPNRPIVALKGGRTEAGQRGARSHTAAMMSNDSVVDALFANGGVVRATTLEELIDVTLLFDSQPVPNGDRVAIVGNVGGPLILAADAAEARGLSVPVLSDLTQQRLREAVPNLAAAANPVDLLATVTGTQLGVVLDLLLASEEIDAIVVVTVPISAESESLGTAAQRQHAAIPVIVADMGEPPGREAPGSFPAPERAVHALSRTVEYATWCRQLRDEQCAEVGLTPRPDRSTRRRIVTAAHSDDGWMASGEAFEVLADVGVEIAPFRVVTTKAELSAAITDIGLPVVLKADAVGVIHKTEANALALGITSLAEALEAFDRFTQVFGDKLRGVLVQRKLGAGLELIVGARKSQRYGPLLLVGAGGTTAEVLGDSVTLLAPASRGDIGRAFRKLRIAPLLAGYRDRPAINLTALCELAYRVGELIAGVPELIELDINPVIANADGITAVDVRMRVDLESTGPWTLAVVAGRNDADDMDVETVST